MLFTQDQACVIIEVGIGAHTSSSAVHPHSLLLSVNVRSPAFRRRSSLRRRGKSIEKLQSCSTRSRVAGGHVEETWRSGILIIDRLWIALLMKMSSRRHCEIREEGIQLQSLGDTGKPANSLKITSLSFVARAELQRVGGVIIAKSPAAHFEERPVRCEAVIRFGDSGRVAACPLDMLAASLLKSAISTPCRRARMLEQPRGFIGEGSISIVDVQHVIGTPSLET